MKKIRLETALSDLAKAEELKALISAGKHELDWSNVNEVTGDFLRMLVGGASMDELVDALGADSMSDELAARVMAAFESAEAASQAPPARTQRKASARDPAPKDKRASTRASKRPGAGMTHEDVRAAVLDALERDLIGPFYETDEEGEAPEEVFELRPSSLYLTGFLVPESDAEIEDPEDEGEMGAGSDETEEETQGAEPEPKQRRMFPSSMGLSVLLPPGSGGSIEVRVDYAEYLREKIADEPDEDSESEKTKMVTVWRRVPQPTRSVEVPLDEKALMNGVALPDTSGLRIIGKLEPTGAPGVPMGTRALALFLVNRRATIEGEHRDEQTIFQTSMELHYEPGFVARPNLAGERQQDPDERVADLQFRRRYEYAVGHGTAVEEPSAEDDGKVTTLRTTWIPRHEVLRVKPGGPPADAPRTIETRMERLAELEADGVEDALGYLVDGYGEWLAEQAKVDVNKPRRREVRDQVVHQAELARARIRQGIDLLASDSQALDAFRRANRVMAAASLQRSPARYNETIRPAWRLFQLAFVLLNLVGVTDEEHADRDNVELIFFPTGGGKTEAYLGVIAYTLLLRRTQGQSRDDKGLGVAVLLRYTLRLLTLDQLSRAATLICALELMRQKEPELLGAERFSVGLWVGRSATANTVDQVKKQILDYKNSNSANAPSPFPLPTCPWCGTELGRKGLKLSPSSAKPQGVTVGCENIHCEFSTGRNRDGLPVLFVDEQIYRELPSFIVGTVDKFAMMPWRGETGMLFGRVEAREGHKFYGPLDGAPRSSTRLKAGLRPPELIVQDELHLISGPLGTMVGLYETAIEFLSSRTNERGHLVRPKVIASTATVRRASQQIRALFGRTQMSLFPPPGIDDSETWFATVDQERSGRLYVGVAAPGRSMKAILLRTYVALLAAAEKHFDKKGTDDQAADPYMTVAGYFNSLRELGGMRRLVEDDVRVRAFTVEKKVPREHEGKHPYFKARKVQPEPVELTSRESTGRIKEAKERLNHPFVQKDAVDVLLASNMISVGVDIDRLGLMVVAGQPKTTAEYIQASSRVGRQYPGLVVTCFNTRKPRDRSHYERFAAYHASFYRYVEATSLTPFSGRALDRGLAGTLVSMARLGTSAMTPSLGAMEIEPHEADARAALASMVARAGEHSSQPRADTEKLQRELQERGERLIESWVKVVRSARDEDAGQRTYSRFDKNKGGKPLLYMVVDDEQPTDPDEQRFVAPTSMRDVEDTVHLWIQRGALGGRN